MASMRCVFAWLRASGMVEQDGAGFDALCGLPDGPRAVADAVENEMPDVLDVEGAAGGFGVEKFDGFASWWGDPWVGWRCGIATRVGVLLGAERRRRLAGSFVVAGRGWQKVASVRLTGFCTTVTLRNVQQTTCGCRTFHGRRPG